MKTTYNIFFNKMIVFLTLLLLFIPSSENIAIKSKNIYNVKDTNLIYVFNNLLEAGADTSFVKMLANSNKIKFNEQYIKINVIGYLTKSDYSSQYNEYSIKKCKEFITINNDILINVAENFNIPLEIITAILWIESKHGTITGNHHVLSVYLSAAMASNEKFIEMNIQSLYEKWKGDSSEFPSMVDKVKTRSIKKSQWAINELLALEKIYKTTNIDILNLYGSWAGAFGWSQFLPSSYINWAADGDMDGNIDLFTIHDAAFSIGNYLKINGWSTNENDQKKAIYHYNNSNDYVDAVFILAKKLNTNYNYYKFDELKIPLNEQLNK